MGLGKDFSKKKTGHGCLSGHNSETKRDIVMGPKGKMVVIHRAKKASITKIVLPKQKMGFLAKMRQLGPILGRGTFWFLPFFFNGEQSSENEKCQFL